MPSAAITPIDQNELQQLSEDYEPSSTFQPHLDLNVFDAKVGYWWRDKWFKLIKYRVTPILKPLVPRLEDDINEVGVSFGMLEDAVTAVFGFQSNRVVFEICHELFDQAEFERGW